MKHLKPKEWHEQHLADVDREKIVEHLKSGHDVDVTKLSVILARQCDLFVHFQRLWQMRVANLDVKLGTEQYMKNIYLNKRQLYKSLFRPQPV